MSIGRIARAHCAFDLDALFPDEAPMTAVPWDVGSRRVDEQDRVNLRVLLASPPRANQFVDLDPRELQASQSTLTRAGVAYYLTGEYRRSGQTYAGQNNVGNKYPIVRERAGVFALLGGHYRSAAALLNGERVLARVVGPAEYESGAAVVVTPALSVGGRAPHFEHSACPDRGFAEVAINMGGHAWLPQDNHHAFTHLLRELAFTEDWLQHQDLHYARTGRIRPVRCLVDDHRRVHPRPNTGEMS